MKVTLTFEADDDQDELRLAMNSRAVMQIFQALHKHMRDKVKYNQELSDEARAALADVQQLMWDQLTDEGLCPMGWL